MGLYRYSAMTATKHERISDDFTHFMSEYLDLKRLFIQLSRLAVHIF